MHTICIIRGSDQKPIKTIHHDILINYADPLNLCKNNMYTAKRWQIKNQNDTKCE